jgi:prepilin-type N-terminal cleavage/methylation domain-containing protein
MIRKGYTLIELVTVMVVMGVVIAIGAPLLIEATSAWSYASPYQNNAVLSAIVAQNRMSREIRRLKNDGSVTAATSSQFSFTDVNNNAIAFTLSGNTLMRNSDGLLDNATGLSFTYYNDSGAAIATPLVSPSNTDIRLVKVNYSVLAAGNTLNFGFTVKPQNLRRASEKLK